MRYDAKCPSIWETGVCTVKNQSLLSVFSFIDFMRFTYEGHVFHVTP